MINKYFYLFSLEMNVLIKYQPLLEASPSWNPYAGYNKAVVEPGFALKHKY